MNRPTVTLLLGSLLLAGLAAAQQQEHHVRGTSPLEVEQRGVITLPDVADPHGSAELCTECHGSLSTGELDTSAPTMAACERCHPDTNFHLVDVEPEEIECPPELLLEGGVVACVTCHDEPACDGLPKQARGEDHFRDGPYRNTLDLCFRCHDRDDYQRTDPHRDLRTKDGERNNAVCIFCHQGVPEDEADEAVSTLRVDPVELCKGCHAHQIHVGIPSHLKLLPDEMRPTVDRFNAGTQQPIPIGPRGEVFCTSCHDPHPGLEPVAVATPPAKLAKLRQNNRDFRDRYTLPRLRSELGAISDADGRRLTLEDGPADKQGLLRVPADDGSLCMVCHDLEAQGK
jgi:hypothetical protein